jgi:UDP-N-acetylmuramoyl-tripeptide--D-alanyl-D-alanine ligase
MTWECRRLYCGWSQKHQAAVVEVGTNHPGELAPLLELIHPQFGVITNIGREHLEFFRDLAGVAQEEGALAEALPATGKLFLNGDSVWTEVIAQRAQATVVRVGFAPTCEWRARNVKLDKNGAMFSVEAPRKEFSGSYRIGLLGRHQVGNALFAIALGAELGLSRKEIERGLAECVPAKMRLQLYEASGVRVLDDAYNANADSMLAALQVLQELPCKGRRVAVLGDMAELGAHSESAHAEVGRLAAEFGVEQLIAVGKMAGHDGPSGAGRGVEPRDRTRGCRSGGHGHQIIFEGGRYGVVEGFAVVAPGADCAGAEGGRSAKELSRTLDAFEGADEDEWIRMLFYLSQVILGCGGRDGVGTVMCRHCGCFATSRSAARARRSRRCC